MSLTSLVASLFAGSSNTQQNRNDFGIVDDGLSSGKQTFADVNLGAQELRADTMIAVVEDEEARPPYLHVRIFAPVYEARTDSARL